MSNKKIDLFKRGVTFQTSLSITSFVLDSFASVSGDYNPIHHDGEYARKKGFPNKVAFGNILGLLISRFVGMHLPSKDVMLFGQSVKYKKPFFESDVITLEGIVESISETVNFVEFRLNFRNQFDDLIATGTCSIILI